MRRLKVRLQTLSISLGATNRTSVPKLVNERQVDSWAHAETPEAFLGFTVKLDRECRAARRFGPCTSPFRRPS